MFANVFTSMTIIECFTNYMKIMKVMTYIILPLLEVHRALIETFCFYMNKFICLLKMLLFDHLILYSHSKSKDIELLVLVLSKQYNDMNNDMRIQCSHDKYKNQLNNLSH